MNFLTFKIIFFLELFIIFEIFYCLKKVWMFFFGNIDIFDSVNLALFTVQKVLKVLTIFILFFLIFLTYNYWYFKVFNNLTVRYLWNFKKKISLKMFYFWEHLFFYQFIIVEILVIFFCCCIFYRNFFPQHYLVVTYVLTLGIV